MIEPTSSVPSVRVRTLDGRNARPADVRDDADLVLYRMTAVRRWPERDVFGKVRAMTSVSAGRKLRPSGYLERFGPEASEP